jgi:hypothetical protein
MEGSSSGRGGDEFREQDVDTFGDVVAAREAWDALDAPSVDDQAL